MIREENIFEWNALFVSVFISVEGVDDNGAGVAAMLEVVRQVTDANKQGTKRQNTLFFASFDGEELGKFNVSCTIRNYTANYMVIVDPGVL